MGVLSCSIATAKFSLRVLFLYLFLQILNMATKATDAMAALITWFRLVCSGDIELNPGPLNEQELLAFTSLLSQSLTLADILMNGMAGAHTEDSVRDEGLSIEKVKVLQ